MIGTLSARPGLMPVFPEWRCAISVPGGIYPA